jgi:site-specific recombinase XerD
MEGILILSILSFIKPYHPVTKDSISRWVKSVLQQAGVDVTKYTAHSSRAATTSHTKRKGLSLQDIMKTAGWTSATTFEKFYHKPAETPKTFGQTVMSED